MALIYLGYRQLKNRKKKKGDDSEEVEEKTVLSEMNLEKQNRKKKTVITSVELYRPFSTFLMHQFIGIEKVVKLL